MTFLSLCLINFLQVLTVFRGSGGMQIHEDEFSRLFLESGIIFYNFDLTIPDFDSYHILHDHILSDDNKGLINDVASLDIKLVFDIAEHHILAKDFNPSSLRTLSRWHAMRSYTNSMRLAFNSSRVMQECEKIYSANIRSFFLKTIKAIIKLFNPSSPGDTIWRTQLLAPYSRYP